ncbi:MAG: pentapeptide repeat-containing protein, partial [Candidatus Eremiobacteraeota bacterium]|nr:pentapeptide repeat-containing protein [Candidatus Eremiobacteraeota bacterium]
MTSWEPGFVTIASAVAAIAVNALWQDALLVVFVWLLLRAWPKINASTRYVVWGATLAAAFVVPVATTLASFTPVRTLSTSASPAASSGHAPTRSARGETARATPAAMPAVYAPERLRVTLSAPLAMTIFGVWLLLAALALARLTIGLLRLEHLKRDALPLPIEYRDSMPQWLRANKGARDVRLCVSDETDVPVAVGLFDAMILVPRSLLEHLSEPEVDQICLHELAHLRRADDWSNGLQRVINALLGWNPAAQFVGQQLDLEREVACDDWVLSYVRQVRPYALCLTKMAETAAWPRRPIPAPGVFATRKHISLRIERLLGVGRNIATNLAPAPAAAALAVVAALTLAIAVVTPSIAAAPIAATGGSRAARVAMAATPTPLAASAARSSVRVEVPGRRAEVPNVKIETAPTHVRVPDTHFEIPATRVDVPATHVDVPATHVEVPATKVDVPAVNVDVPGAKVNVPGVQVEAPGAKVEVPNVRVDVQKANFDATKLADNITHSIASSVMQGLHGTSIAQGNSCVGCDYSGVNWAGRDLHGANYKSVDFSKANLAGTNLSGSVISGGDFSEANLSGASFRNAHLTGCDFSDANLSGVDFTNARMTGCQFTGARLGSSQLRDALSGCKGCDFSRADLGGLDLRGVRVNGDDFSGANLR